MVPASSSPVQPRSDRDDRLAERDDHDQREALGEVPGRDAEATHAEDERPGEVDRQRDDPEGGLRRAVEERCRDQECGRRERRPRQPPDRLAGVHVVVRQGEDEDVQPACDGVGEREHERVVAEGLRYGQRGDQERAHDSEHQKPLAILLGGHVVREPGVRGPGPPERRQHEHSPTEPRPGRVLGHQRRAPGSARTRRPGRRTARAALHASPRRLPWRARITADERSIKPRALLSTQGRCAYGRASARGSPRSSPPSGPGRPRPMSRG